jgi:tetratricopeptide (TPR) repeat protein
LIDNIDMNAELFQEATTLFRSGSLERAAVLFHRVYDEAEDSLEKVSILLNESLCYTAMRDFGRAEAVLHIASQLLPAEHRWRARIEYAEAAIDDSRGHWEQSLAKMDAIVNKYRPSHNSSEEDDLYESLQMSRGCLLAKLERWEEAAPVLEEALSFGGDRDLLLYYLGQCKMMKDGLWREAEALFLEALQSGSGNDLSTAIHYHLGQTYFNLGDYRKALTEFQLCNSPSNVQAVPRRLLLGWLAAAHDCLGNYDEAISCSNAAKKLGRVS